MSIEQQQLKRQAGELYERVALPLEAQYSGQYIAITVDGRFVLGDTALEAAQRASDRFGPGVFLFKLGPRVVGRWR